MGKKNKSKQNLKSGENAEAFSESANTSSKSVVSTTSASEVSISIGTEEVTFSVASHASKDNTTGDPFEEIKKAIDSSNDKMSGLQDSLSENRTRLAAMLGLGEIESSPRSASVTPTKRTPDTSFADDGSVQSFQYFALEKETKEQKKLIDQLKRDKAIADLAVVEKARLLAEKTKENEKLHIEIGQLSSKTSEITVIHSHIREIETHIHASCMELYEFNGTTVEGAYTGSGHDAQHNSKRIVRLMSLLTALKTQLKNKTEDLSKSNSKIEALNKLVAEHKQDIADANHAIHELEEDLQKEGDKYNKSREVSQNIIKALKNQVADLKVQAGIVDTSSPRSGTSSAAGSTVNLLEAVEVESLRKQMTDMAAKYAKDTTKSHDELEAVRSELLATINELNSANQQLADSLTQHAEQETAWAAKERSLQGEKDKLAKDLTSARGEVKNIEEVRAALDKKVTQLQSLYQQSLAEKKSSSPKKESSTAAASSVGLEKENKDLRSSLSQLSESHSASVAEYTKRITELQNHLTSAEASSTARIEELTASLKASTDALSSHMSAKSNESKNSEKLIAALEVALDNSKKEVVSLTTKNTELENKIADQHRALQDKKTSRSNSHVDSSSNEELSIIRKELLSKSQEVLELKDRVTELTASNSKLQENLLAQQKAAVKTEGQHGAEVLQMLSEMGEMKSAHAVAVEGLKSKLSKARQERAVGDATDYSSSARVAETKVAFTKEAFRTHLKLNGVKVFLWDDMLSLMRKLEELHSTPHHPITYVSDLVDVTTTAAGASSTAASGMAQPTPEVSPKAAVSVTGTQAVAVPTVYSSHPAVTPRKKSMAFTPKRSSSKRTPKRTAFFGEDEGENLNSSNNRHTPVTVGKASFHYGGSFAHAPFQSLSTSKAVKHTPEVKSNTWRSACVDKADPFGDLREKTKSMRVSYKETEAKFNSFKATSPVNFSSSPTSFYNSKANIDRFLESNGGGAEGTEKYLESIGAVVVSDNDEEEADTM